MRLYEFEDDFEKDDPLRVETTAALSRIKASIEDSGYKGEYKIKSLLAALRDHGVHLDKERLIKVSKQEPWCNFIANLKGDNVIFKGEPVGDSENQDPDETTDTMEKMADRAGKKQANPLA